MPSYDELSDDQKKALDDLLSVYRPACAATQSLLATLRAVQLEGNQPDVLSALSALDLTEEIPNKTGLADAKPVSKELLKEHLDAIDFVLDGNEAISVEGFDSPEKQRERQLFAGINAIISPV